MDKVLSLEQKVLIIFLESFHQAKKAQLFFQIYRHRGLLMIVLMEGLLMAHHLVSNKEEVVLHG